MDAINIFTRAQLWKEAPSPHWLQLNHGRYFVLKAFDAANSALIDEALKTPELFALTDNGHVFFTGANGRRVELINPLSKNDNVKSIMLSKVSLAALRARDENDETVQFTWDKSNVISANLRYILKRDDAGKWFLLYNPLHRKHFKEEYVATINERPDSVEWAGTREPSKTRMALNTLFDAYCNDFKVTDGSTVRYLDPTCNLFLSSASCGNSALFMENKVEYEKKAVEGARTILSYLRSGDPPNCMCTGYTQAYYKNRMGGKESESFLSKVRSMEKCNPQFQVNYCSMQFDAHTVSAENSSIVNACGGFGVADSSEDPIIVSGTTRPPAPPEPALAVPPQWPEPVGVQPAPPVAVQPAPVAVQPAPPMTVQPAPPMTVQPAPVAVQPAPIGLAPKALPQLLAQVFSRGSTEATPSQPSKPIDTPKLIAIAIALLLVVFFIIFL